jgi:chromosome segregation protein
VTYIKKLVMHGFKSFANKTEVNFDKGINVIIGPNGSGKSNVSDALCFVLGRLSSKSIRAAKAKNLLFMGSKYVKPSREATVELVFDNSDHTFPVDREEISIKRTVKANGLSIYKINDELKTRADVVETLGQAGIDSYGFNLVLQGQIQQAVAMHPEDRRKVIEEVAGISIYETRKEKSLKELEKTEERLKEINAILRERTAFLRNLENERQQALKFKELEQTVRRCKASILSRKIEDKMKELGSIQKSIEEKSKQKDWEGITRFKVGFAPATAPTVYPGTHDIILDSRGYLLYDGLRHLQMLKRLVAR